SKEEHAELPVVGGSQPRDHVTSASRDKIKPFNAEQIRELIEKFKPIKGQLEALKDRLKKMSLEEIERDKHNMEKELQKIVEQLNQIDRAGDYDRTKKN